MKLLFVVPLLAALAPFPDWDQDTVLRMVSDSAWAKQRTVRLHWIRREERPITYKDIPGADHGQQVKVGSPVGGIGAPKPRYPDRSTLILRWASALPVRQAKALYRQRDEKLEIAKLPELVGANSNEYILEIFGVPAEVGHQGTGVLANIVKQSATLRTGRGRMLRPTRVDATLRGTHIEILVYFERSPALELADKELEFRCDMQIFQLHEKFPLRDMQYAGRLEL